MTTTIVQKYKVNVIFDTAATIPINDGNVDNSKVLASPSAIQIQNIPAGTSVNINARVSPDADWVLLKNFTSTDGKVLYHFGVTYYNYVQVVRVGVGAIKAFAQL